VNKIHVGDRVSPRTTQYANMRKAQRLYLSDIGEVIVQTRTRVHVKFGDVVISFHKNMLIKA